MTSKRPTKEAPAKAGAKPRNKQRITLLTRKERAAALSGAWLDERVPEADIECRLRDEPGAHFQSERIMEVLRRRVAWCRWMQTPEANRMEPREIAAQAMQTAAVASELLERLQHMHPNLAAHATDILFRAHEGAILYLADRLRPDLYRLIAVMGLAAADIHRSPVKPGEKHTERKAAKAELAKVLLANSAPPLSKLAAAALADDLLTLCGLPNRRVRA